MNREVHSLSIRKSAGASLAFNVFLVFAKGFAGLVGHSSALLADAVESAGDVLSSLLVYFGLRYSTRPPDHNHPYGHGRIEPLIIFAVVFIIFASAGLISYHAIMEIQTPGEPPLQWTLYVLVAVIISKFVAAQLLMRKAKAHNGSSLRAEAQHHRMDGWTSCMTLLGVSIAVFGGEAYAVADEIAALLGAIIMLYNAYKMFRPAISEALDEHIHDEIVAEIRRASLEIEGVRGTEKCFVRKVGSIYFADLHLEVSGTLTVLEGHTIAHLVKDHLLERIVHLQDVLIHVEPAEGHMVDV